MIIRTIEKEDVEQVLSLALAFHTESRYSHIPFSMDRARYVINLCLSNPMFRATVAEQDGKIVGASVVVIDRYIFSDEKMMTDIGMFVLPENRGYQIAVALIKAAEEWGRANGVHTMLWGSTAAHDHERVGKLFERCGLSPWGMMYRKEL